MAEKKTRKFATWRIKWILLYIAILLLFLFGLIATIIFVKNTTIKIVAIVYEGIVILLSIVLPIAVKVIANKEKKKKLQYGISKEEQEKYLQQAKKCNIYAK